MDSNLNILIVDKFGRLSNQLRESLHDNGHASHVFSTVESAEKEIGRLKNPIVVLDCGLDEKEVFFLVKSLMGSQSLQRYPVLVTGKNINKYETHLKQFCKYLNTLAAPSDWRDTMTAIERIIKAHYLVDDANARKSQTNSESVEPQQDRKSVQEVKDAGKTVVDIFQKEAKNLKLSGRTLGGRQYLNLRREEDFTGLGHLPTEVSALKAIDQLLDKVGEWGRSHLHRSAYITTQMAKVFEFENVLEDQTKAAAFLYACSFPEGDRTLLRQNYIRDTSDRVRQELSGRVRQSAEKIYDELGLSEVSEIVMSIGRLIALQDQETESPIGIAASTVLASDLTDRVCWQAGHWDPRASYHFMRHIKSGEIRNINSGVLACTVKLLAEAVSATSPSYLLPKEMIKNKKLMHKAAELRDAPLKSGEVRVKLTKLEAGMKLSRALCAFDGREIIPSETVLDQDLIWRIWQMAALRPINDAVVYQSGATSVRAEQQR